MTKPRLKAPTSTPFVSVIVPVFNDAERLAVALASLERQTYEAERFEVVVVDNGSDESPAEIVAQFPHARLENESRPGSYAARNHGIAAAKGDVLAFTDADCEASPGWLEHGVRALLSLEHLGIVAGDYRRLPQDPSRPTATELYELVTHPDARDRAEREHFGLTGNLLTHRSLFEAVGPFDADRLSQEDRAWCLRAHAAGFPVVYCAAALVTETGARSSLRRHLLKTRRLVGGKMYAAGSDLGGRVKNQPWRKLVPPFADLKQYLAHPGLTGVGQKLRVCLMTVLTHYVSGFERLRLMLGGRPERR